MLLFGSIIVAYIKIKTEIYSISILRCYCCLRSFTRSTVRAHIIAVIFNQSFSKCQIVVWVSIQKVIAVRGGTGDGTHLEEWRQQFQSKVEANRYFEMPPMDGGSDDTMHASRTLKRIIGNQLLSTQSINKNRTNEVEKLFQNIVKFVWSAARRHTGPSFRI